MKLYEYVNDCFRRYGCKKVFGVPGSLIMPIWQNIEDNTEIVLCSHEQEASYIAVGYGKSTRNLVGVITIGSPGVTNCISGLASSNIDSVPLIYISGRTPISENGCGVRQEESIYNRKFDSNDLLHSVTKKSVCVDCVETASEKISEAFECALSGRCGCVHISIPLDLQEKEIPKGKLHEIKRFRHVLMTHIESRPLIIMGWGCWMANAADEVYRLSEVIGAPILVTSKAYCCIESNHPFYLGKLGYGYAPQIKTFLDSYRPDQILIFGSSLGEKDINGDIEDYLKSTKICAWGNDLEMIKKKYPCAILCKTTNMADDIKKLTHNNIGRIIEHHVIEAISRTKKEICKYWEDKIESRDFMAKAIKLINEIPGNIVVTADAGNHLLNAGALLFPKSVGNLFIDVGIRSMGSGLCAAVGMAFADNKKKYVAVTGDGCMLMNGNVMHLISVYNLPVVILIFNNHSLGRVRVGQSVTGKYRSTDIYHVDFVLYAKSFGLRAYRFDSFDEYSENVKDIIQKECPVVIEVVTDHDEVPVTLKENIY